MAASASLLLSLAASILFFLFPPSSTNDSNVLLTGDVLGTDSQLSYAGATFVMQGDCNLVLYNKGRGFQSDTHGDGVNCTLALTDRGQFVVSRYDGHAVWNSTLRNETKRGKYAAILRPDGEVAVYGPVVWSTPDFGFPRAAGHEAADLAATLPTVKNVLFSSQTLDENGELETRDYTLVMKQSCDLELVKASGGFGIVWKTGTAGKGRRCFLRLDHRGQLAIVGDHVHHKSLWSSKNASAEGEYVLLLQINGQAVVYGPEVWSTSSSSIRKLINA